MAEDPLDMHGLWTRKLEHACTSIAEERGLTSRETEVLMLLAQGKTASTIQEDLVISYNTAKAHIRHIYTKLDVHTQQELLRLVERVGVR